MSLQGSLETFALPEVLKLLAGTGKTGELRVTTPRGTGQVFFQDGLVGGSGFGRSTQPEDVVFELLRTPQGSFTFSSTADFESTCAIQVQDVLSKALAQLEEWREIEAVVPSLASMVELVPELSNPSVSLGAPQWQVVVATTSRSTVEKVVERLGWSEFVTCRLVKELVELGVARVIAAQAEGLVSHDRAPAIEMKDHPKDLVDESAEAVVAAAEAVEAAAVEAAEASEAALADHQDKLDRWAELRALVALDDPTAPVEELEERELTEEEAERAAQIMAAEGADALEGEKVDRAQVLRFLSSVRI